MNKDLTSSKIARQNVLNNKYALQEIQKAVGLPGIIFKGQLVFTKQQVASFFGVSQRSVDTCIRNNDEELAFNGYELLKGKSLKDFKLACLDNELHEVNFAKNTPQLGIFNFRAVLNIAMLLTRSERAKEVRSLILDIVIDTVNKRTGGATKYINQRDEDFIHNLLTNVDYHQELVDALRDCVNLGQIKYIIYNDMVYKSIFKENADEYRRILRLSNEEDERMTMYSEVLDLIASYEAGFADVIRHEFENNGRKLLTQARVDELYGLFESQRLWVPLINKARSKMASRDLCFRDALHQNLVDHIGAVPPEDFNRFIGERSMALSERIEQYVDALKRLKDRN